MTTQTFIVTLPNQPPAILDFTLAEQLGTETKRINQIRSRHPERFPTDFAFQLTETEIKFIRSQYVTILDNQQVMTWFRYRPWAYTEEGVAMVAGILNTPQAIEASVLILRLFRNTRKALTVSREFLDTAYRQLEHAHQEILIANPKWKKILRYRLLGLSQRDIGKLLGVTQRCIWGHLARMKQCGLIASTGSLVPRN